jgi:REP element-mobilizing transposase RayT
MVRKLWLEFAGACYHAIDRGNYRRALFARGGAAESFQVCLREACESFGWRIHAHGIMRSHFHPAVETPEPNLSEGKKWLQGTWAMRFNRFRGECGRPFQGRYKAKLIEPGYVLAEVAHYVHSNPLVAGIVNSRGLADYP